MKKKGVIIVIASLLAIAVAVVGLWVYFGKQGDEAEKALEKYEVLHLAERVSLHTALYQAGSGNYPIGEEYPLLLALDEQFQTLDAEKDLLLSMRGSVLPWSYVSSLNSLLARYEDAYAELGELVEG